MRLGCGVCNAGDSWSSLWTSPVGDKDAKSRIRAWALSAASREHGSPVKMLTEVAGVCQAPNVRLWQCGLTLIESACASTSCHCSPLSSGAIYRLNLLHFHIISFIILTSRQETSHIALDTTVTASQLWIPSPANSPHFDRPSSPGCPSKGLG